MNKLRMRSTVFMGLPIGRSRYFTAVAAYALLLGGLASAPRQLQAQILDDMKLSQAAYAAAGALSDTTNIASHTKGALWQERTFTVAMQNTCVPNKKSSVGLASTGDGTSRFVFVNARGTASIKWRLTRGMDPSVIFNLGLEAKSLQGSGASLATTIETTDSKFSNRLLFPLGHPKISFLSFGKGAKEESIVEGFLRQKIDTITITVENASNTFAAPNAPCDLSLTLNTTELAASASAKGDKNKVAGATLQRVAKATTVTPTVTPEAATKLPPCERYKNEVEAKIRECERHSLEVVGSCMEDVKCRCGNAEGGGFYITLNYSSPKKKDGETCNSICGEGQGQCDDGYCLPNALFNLEKRMFVSVGDSRRPFIFLGGLYPRGLYPSYSKYVSPKDPEKLPGLQGVDRQCVFFSEKKGLPSPQELCSMDADALSERIMASVDLYPPGTSCLFENSFAMRGICSSDGKCIPVQSVNPECQGAQECTSCDRGRGTCWRGLCESYEFVAQALCSYHNFTEDSGRRYKGGRSILLEQRGLCTPCAAGCGINSSGQRYDWVSARPGLGLGLPVNMDGAQCSREYLENGKILRLQGMCQGGQCRPKLSL